jgi:hypothetical protein
MKLFKASLVVVLMATVAWLYGNSPIAVAQQNASSGQAADKLPSDVHPETLARISWATRDEFTKPEDQAAFDRAIAAAPMYANPKNGEIAGNGMRLHIPVVHIAYRDTIQNLNRDNGLDARYSQLATLVGCRETNEEYDWVEHEKSSEKSLPRNVVEIVRNKQDTKGLEEKDALVIQFGRELFHQPKVSSKTYADMIRLFGQRQTLAMTLIMAHYNDNALLYRAFDQHMDSTKKRPFPDVLAAEATH